MAVDRMVHGLDFRKGEQTVAHTAHQLLLGGLEQLPDSRCLIPLGINWQGLDEHGHRLLGFQILTPRENRCE